jgi:hypothetical protein
MIDPRHKILQVIQEYMEIYIVLSIVKEYAKVVMPMFIEVYKNLNLTNVVPLQPIPLFDEALVFEQFVSNDDPFNHC